MRRHLNTLYVTSEGAWVRKERANVVVEVDGAERGRVPVHLLGSLVCFGRVGVSPPLLGLCAEQGVCVSFMTEYGRFLARVEGPVSGNVLLRRAQYRATDDHDIAISLVREIVTGKLLNQRAVIRRTLRDHGDTMESETRSKLEAAERRFTDAARRAQKPLGIEELRGIEGETAQAYFDVFDCLIRGDGATFHFERRSRRPPLNPINALLSFLYVLLLHDCRSALETVGLDPAVGFLHRERPGRPSLALDIMEELRPVLADRVALSLVNRRQISAQDFETAVSGAVSMTQAGRKIVLAAYQDRKKDELKHPFLDEKTTLGLVPFVQSQLLARRLRGDLDGYPPFTWK